VNWATNIRKRNLKGTVERGKKPHHFLDFLFLAVHREKEMLESSGSRYEARRSHVDKKGKKNARVKTHDDMVSVDKPNVYQMVTPISHPSWIYHTFSEHGQTYRQIIAENVSSTDYFLGSYPFHTGSVPNSSPTSVDNDMIQNDFLSYGARAVSPSFDDKGEIFSWTKDTIMDESMNSKSIYKKAKITPNASYKRSNSLREALQYPEEFWLKTGSTMEDKFFIEPIGNKGDEMELLWNDTEVLQKFTQGGLLSTPRRLEGEEDDDLSLKLGNGKFSHFHPRGISRASLTENEIMYLLSTDQEDDDPGTFIDLDLNNNDCLDI
jgi:hypothetical protein